MVETLTIENVVINKGKRQRLEIGVAKLFDHTEMTIPVEVVRGKAKTVRQAPNRSIDLHQHPHTLHPTVSA